MLFFDGLVNDSTDLDEIDKYQYIAQTVGQHLYNYLIYNRRTPDQISLLLNSLKKNFAGGPQKHMEIVSLDVLIRLRQKNRQWAMDAICDLPLKQLDYIKQIADEYKPELAADIEQGYQAR